MIIYDDKHPRGLWKLGKIESVRKSADGSVRGACVRVQSGTGHSTVLRRPIQHLYPLEVRCQEPPNLGSELPSTTLNPDEDSSTEPPPASMRPPRRATALQARDRILGCNMTD